MKPAKATHHHSLFSALLFITPCLVVSIMVFALNHGNSPFLSFSAQRTGKDDPLGSHYSNSSSEMSAHLVELAQASTASSLSNRSFQDLVAANQTLPNPHLSVSAFSFFHLSSSSSSEWI
ncbi:hypothetical protein Nepgr_013835 [Nepenthes gracilis]|uniref:Uncharacterized protein n=1 Tax=Nepenthes gracilis TaxID=150966 RepID=A0AAD3SJL8_NEPGR|nr:hypothetical protein Nepgr_013835 [Nepenthes gracilis]